MAEDWVLKGSLKGPQGEPGLPEGGTEGQVLTKTADGEEWQDFYLKISNIGANTVFSASYEGQDVFIDGFSIIPYDTDPDSGSLVKAISFSSGAPSIDIKGENGNLVFRDPDNNIIAGIGVVNQNTPQFRFSDKTVTSITDAISSTDSDRANELVTGKAVADYVAENAPSVDTSNLVNYNVSTKNLERYLGGRICELTIPSTTNSDRCISISSDQVSRIVVAETSSKGVTISSDMDTSGIVIDGYSNLFQMGSKYVLSITDDASGGSDSALVTAKAVADAIPTAADPDELVAYVKNYGGGA